MTRSNNIALLLMGTQSVIWIYEFDGRLQSSSRGRRDITLGMKLRVILTGALKKRSSKTPLDLGNSQSYWPSEYPRNYIAREFRTRSSRIAE